MLVQPKGIGCELLGQRILKDSTYVQFPDFLNYVKRMEKVEAGAATTTGIANFASDRALAGIAYYGLGSIEAESAQKRR